jgi:hypothetical protein
MDDDVAVMVAVKITLLDRVAGQKQEARVYQAPVIRRPAGIGDQDCGRW